VDYRNAGSIFLWAEAVMSHPAGAGRRDRPQPAPTSSDHLPELAARPGLCRSAGRKRCTRTGYDQLIIREGIYDRDFVRDWCIGFEQLRERAAEYTLDRVAQITCLPADDILKAARMSATVRPCIHHGRMGVQQNRNCVQTNRAISILLAICGSLDVKGGHVYKFNKPKGFKGVFHVVDSRDELRLPPEIEDLRIGAQEYPLFSGAESMAVSCAHPPGVVHTILSEEPYPIKANWFLNDMAVCLEGQRETYEAVKSLEFTVGSDFFMTPTMEICDVILPHHVAGRMVSRKSLQSG
jgi:anaerobic selenocysteine-containing dehydrogenase